MIKQSVLAARTARIACALALLAIAAAPASAFTIATFADPSPSGTTPLFTIDLGNDLVTGGWPDANTGLTLTFPDSGNTYSNAFFTMTPPYCWV